MDTLTTEERSARMRLVKSRGTKPELALRGLVWALGYRYRKNRADVVGRPDIAFAKTKCAIFLHGCFWHRHSCPAGIRSPKTRTDFWRKKFDSNVRRDAAVQRALKDIGWKCLVVWECELQNPASVTRRVRKFLDA